MSKRKSKVKLPTDRNGEPIHVGDVLVWDYGDSIKVESLTYYGDEFDVLGFRWVANVEDNDKYADNLSGGEIVWRAKS